MAIILDSGVIPGGERGTVDLERWLASRPSQEFEVAALTVAELWHGVERATAKHRMKRQTYLENALRVVRIIPCTEQTARIHARPWAQLESSGRKIGDDDLIIAATAIERGCAVATFNRSHFSVVKGLKVIELAYGLPIAEGVLRQHCPHFTGYTPPFGVQSRRTAVHPRRTLFCPLPAVAF
jgi:tRNA(fMet)-specific endonuclease VapC